MAKVTFLVTFEECRNPDGRVPNVAIPVDERIIDQEDFGRWLLEAAVEGISIGAAVQHPGLGDKLDPRNFVLVRNELPAGLDPRRSTEELLTMRHYVLRSRPTGMPE